MVYGTVLSIFPSRLKYERNDSCLRPKDDKRFKIEKLQNSKATRSEEK